MRTAILLTAGWVASGVQAGVVPTVDGVSPTFLFDKRLEVSNSSAEHKVLEADLWATNAGIVQRAYQSSTKPSQWKKCHSGNLVVRQEWSTFSKPQKKAYIAAVKCLSRLPPKTPKDVCPGCQNRYDDFLATHIQQSFTIHGTGNFLAWHRWFVYAYEKTLRDECGYKGTQPYYNWPRWSDDPEKSPALDGSDTSMSGNGVLGCTNQTSYGVPSNAAPLISIPHGTGGGCVASGPFKDWPVNLGPISSDLTCTPPNPITDVTSPQLGLGYNPRCLKRDISPWTSRQWSNDEQVVKLLKSPDIKTFWADMQGGEKTFTNNFMGVHTAGHFTVGADPGSDFFASPGDPWFYLHHGQIDRVWWTWQNTKPEERTNALYGTIVIVDPTAPATKLNDTISLGYAFAENITIAETMSTMAGPFCYTYV
ncbi:Di-copper centre-containing protein [Dothidotthia symphoricarpi CBS 119687]|uniref:Di-copper centre-containing protein n=1 Tax=Dothidotthia symphoricarpi CBS 119687 TaxID=1392245 RepID=A0A6A6AG30_9PLEO|nr:Di-copper centre-containing protein [Dothidotthia symphoricarpi CBS 119687]KAF2129371.1 Di-copper centre-containing protein [Dothidotthia symphoricarpi CBS 119687]